MLNSMAIEEEQLKEESIVVAYVGKKKRLGKENNMVCKRSWETNKEE